MASWSSTCWIHLVILVLTIKLSAMASPPHYIIHQPKATFDQAMKTCSPGVLTTIATQEEVNHILRLISQELWLQSEFTFWVGLKKAKNKCVVPTVPLRGFLWTEDGSDKTQVSRWLKEPQATCTTVRCAALHGAFNGSTAVRWGLIAVTCRNTSVHPFICKERDSETTHTPVNTKTTVQPAAMEPSTPKTSLQGQQLEPEHELLGLDHDAALGSGVCQNPRIPGARALRPDPDDRSRIQVECWSTVQLELFCKGRPAMWHHLDDSLANFTTACRPCSDGFRKNATGICVDVDECSSAPCRHTCLNTEGSYRCVCSDESGGQHDGDSPQCSGLGSVSDRLLLSILLPLLVAVVVLVVVVAVTVKCCLMRGSKKRKLEKSETAAMQNKDCEGCLATTDGK